MRSIEEAVQALPNRSDVVIAGPGTGKSYRIGRRIDWLTSEAVGVRFDEIVVLTLTRATTASLKDDLRDQLVAGTRVQTMHSFALWHLNQIGDARDRRAADEWEQRKLVAPDIKMLAMRSGLNIRVDAVEPFLRKLGAGFRTTQTDAPRLTTEEEALRAAWQSVREFLRLRLMDELAYDLMELLRGGHDLVRIPRSILVDEYQDLTAIELELLHLISDRYGVGVFACGDDRQSIYGFREADPFGLNRFSGVYGTGEPVFMSESRRCPPAVLRLAEAAAGRMPDVPGITDRPAMTSIGGTPPGEVRAATFGDPSAEARWIVGQVDLKRAEEGGSTIAVIVPAYLREYIKALNEAAATLGSSLHFRDSRALGTVDQELGYRFLFAILRLALDEADELAWRTLVLLARPISDRALRACSRMFVLGIADPCHMS